MGEAGAYAAVCGCLLTKPSEVLLTLPQPALVCKQPPSGKSNLKLVPVRPGGISRPVNRRLSCIDNVEKLFRFLPLSKPLQRIESAHLKGKGVGVLLQRILIEREGMRELSESEVRLGDHWQKPWWRGCPLLNQVFIHLYRLFMVTLFGKDNDGVKPRPEIFFVLQEGREYG